MGDNRAGQDSKVPAVDAKVEIDPIEERNFVWRLDIGLLTIGFLGYMFKYIDQTNISNAYVSGMKEELSLYGNELNYFTTYFNIGYIIMLFPSCIIISYIGPSKWLPACEVMWGVLTCCLSLAKNAKQVYGIRFLIGFCEGTAWPAYFTMISQWYMPHEIALRMSIYNIAQPTGAMLSGAMQGALSTNLDGALGRSGWRWAFIINGVCTIFIALAAFFILPGYPESQNPLSKFYLKPRHIVAWAFGGNFTPANYYNLWLKSLKKADGTTKYSVATINYLPIIGQAVQLVAELLFSGFSDLFGKHLPFLLLHSAINITSLAILIVRPTNQHAYMAGWYMNYIGGVSTMILCAWASIHLQDEPQVRTVLFAAGTVLTYILTATIPLAAYPASQAPHWHIGAKLYMAFAAMSVFVYIGIHFGFRRDRKKQRASETDTDS